ncbi:MAG: FAD-binding protein [Bacteroidia bacterium]|nr:FAD-binding protein [Bacteroidia bacterium]
MDIDYIIVGQGLAGSAVAVHSMLRGKRIMVVDQYANNTTSRVAAGLFNPVTGKVMSKTWMADILFPVLHHYYDRVESATGMRFFHKMPIYRPFKGADEQNEWMGNIADPAWQPYIGEWCFTHGRNGVRAIAWADCSSGIVAMWIHKPMWRRWRNG